MKISVIIPNWNNAEWLERCLYSVLKQTYKPFEVIVVDDRSTDNSIEVLQSIITKDINIRCIRLTERRYNGGARNIGIDLATGDYIFFLDSDDYIIRDNLFEEIAKHNGVDLIRLNYIKETESGKSAFVLNNTSLEAIIEDINVACWLKVTKRELCPRFPENTLMEDVIYHLRLMENIKTFVNINDPAIMWNRLNVNSVSKSKIPKWCSSLYRYYADLLDLELKNPYCEKERQRRLKSAYSNIKNDNFIC